MRNRALFPTVLMTACAATLPQPAVPRPERIATIDEFLRLGGRPRVIAHRGFSAVAPENTLAAVRRAIKVGADMVEIDVGLTRDGQVVVLHDATLGRTTDGRGRLAETTLAEVRRLDAGSWFAPEFAGEKVPTLAEVLDLVRGAVLLDAEIKTEAVTDEAEGGIADKVLRLVRERGMFDQVIVSSFDPRALVHARRLEAEARTASIYNQDLHRGMSPIEIMTAAGSQALHVKSRKAGPEIVRETHQYDRPVAVYTINDEARMRRFIAMGVDALITDRPDRLLRLLAEASGAATLAAAGGR